MWDEEPVGKCVEILNSVILQVEVRDRWVWRLHPSQCYNVKTCS